MNCSALIEIQQSGNEDQWFISNLISVVPKESVKSPWWRSPTKEREQFNLFFFVEWRSTSCRVGLEENITLEEESCVTLNYTAPCCMWWNQTIDWCPLASLCPPLWMRGDGRRPRHPQPSHQWSHSELSNLSGKYTDILVFSIVAWEDKFSNKVDFYIHIIRTWLKLEQLKKTWILSRDIIPQEASTREQNSPYPMLVQRSWLQDKRRRWQIPRWATSHSTTSWSPSSQTTERTELHFIDSF